MTAHRLSWSRAGHQLSLGVALSGLSRVANSASWVMRPARSGMSSTALATRSRTRTGATPATAIASYEPGDSFPSLDGCNTCTCLDGGGVACTERPCACDPESEWWRNYVGSSPEECALINFVCPESTAYFQSACGCGCEQDASCPPSFNCMPPEPCDVEAIQQRCPYSDIVY